MTAVNALQAGPVTVIRGRPAPVELAAALAVLYAAAAGRAAAGAPAQAPPSAWARRSRVPAAPPVPGPGSWRASALPL